VAPYGVLALQALRLVAHALVVEALERAGGPDVRPGRDLFGAAGLALALVEVALHLAGEREPHRGTEREDVIRRRGESDRRGLRVGGLVRERAERGPVDHP